MRVRFRNTGGKAYLQAEAHLVYQTKNGDATKVTFDWTDDAGPHSEAHVFNAAKAGAWTSHGPKRADALGELQP